MAVISAVLGAGLRVPEDVSGVGFDGIRVHDGLCHRTIWNPTPLVQPFVQEGQPDACAAPAMLDWVER